MKVGAIIDEMWEVVEIYGGGGQGQVYKVRKAADPNSMYALKFLNKQNDIERRTRMYKDALFLLRLMDSILFWVYSTRNREE